MKRLRLLCAGLIVLILAPLVLYSTAAPAIASMVAAHGKGVVWLRDHTSWIGNYLLDDGRHGYCLDVEKPPPGAAEFDYVDGATAGWYAPDDAARLRFIAENWGAPDDPLTAAAAQLAVWTITGLAGHDQAYFARRANADADEVLVRTSNILAAAGEPGGASRGATAALELDLDGAGGTITSQILVDYIAGAQTVPGGRFAGTVELRGATFADGSRSAVVRNGETVPIRPDQSGAVESVGAEIRFRDLPFGSSFRLGRNLGTTQNLLVDSPFPIEARATAEAVAPNDLPFRPRVQTVTSDARAEPGAELSDVLTIDVHPDSATGGEWAVYRRTDGSLAPIPLTVESVLRGPFGRPPVKAAAAPENSPVVCTLETVIEAGPTTVETSGCRIDAPGYYVWTDSIDPARTPPEHGGDRLQAWHSEFGVTSETSMIPARPVITTQASTGELESPGCVHDRLSVSGLPDGAAELRVTTRLIGPLASEPADGGTPVGWEHFAVAGTVITAIDHNGVHETPCVTIDSPGFYYFVFDTAEVAGVPGGEPLVEAVSDHRVHAEESVTVAPPVVSPPKALAQTGRDAPANALWTATTVMAIAMGLAGVAFTLRSRR